MSKRLVVATLDAETDPFKQGRVPKPFAWGFFIPELEDYSDTWGDNCTRDLVELIQAKQFEHDCDFLIFAHNGGRFDFHFLFPYMTNPIRIINGRIVKAAFLDGNTLQDSFSMIPTALKEGGGKIKIDYDKFERGEREKKKNKADIRRYLEEDCIQLADRVLTFHKMFGRKMTVGATSMGELRKIYQFTKMKPGSVERKEGDAYFRQFYYGGRVETIEPGDHTGNFKVYDVNSMYPHVMRSFRHPINAEWERAKSLPDGVSDVYFADITAASRGALPLPTKDGIDFPHGTFRYLACSHEIRAGIRLGLLEVLEVHDCHRAVMTTNFSEYIDKFYQMRLDYRKDGDEIAAMLVKYLLNSSYGKFGQDPTNFRDWMISLDIGNNDLEDDGYELYSTCDYFDLWCKASIPKITSYNDVSIAASITSAARSVLMDALTHSKGALYCDTDSIICTALDCPVDPGKLGAWKLEEQCDRVVIAGKKLYALGRYGVEGDNGLPLSSDGKTRWLKVRTKGGTLAGDDIVNICRGGEVLFQSDRPTFSPELKPRFISRTFRKTAKSRNIT